MAGDRRTDPVQSHGQAGPDDRAAAGHRGQGRGSPRHALGRAAGQYMDDPRQPHEERAGPHRAASAGCPGLPGGPAPQGGAGLLRRRVQRGAGPLPQGDTRPQAGEAAGQGGQALDAPRPPADRPHPDGQGQGSRPARGDGAVARHQGRRVYNRHDHEREKREALAAMASLLQRILDDTEAGVVELPRSA